MMVPLGNEGGLLALVQVRPAGDKYHKREQPAKRIKRKACQTGDNRKASFMLSLHITRKAGKWDASQFTLVCIYL
jgi:hypothetical protein